MSTPSVTKDGGFMGSPPSSHPNSDTNIGPDHQPAEPDKRPAYSDDATFDNAAGVRYYKPMSQYEGLHRWDPDFEWEEAEEQKVIRKVTEPSMPNFQQSCL